MTDTQTDRAVQTDAGPSPGTAVGPIGKRATFIRNVASAPYEQQVQMLSPEGGAMGAALPAVEPAGAVATDAPPPGEAVQFSGQSSGESWPKTNSEYITHIVGKFGDSHINKLKEAGEKIKELSQKAEKEDKTLDDQTTRIAEFTEQMKNDEGKLTEKQVKILGYQKQSAERAQHHAGSTHEDLRATIEKLLGPSHTKKEAAKVTDKKALEEIKRILAASIELGNQLNPEFAEDARSFYKKLDKEENPRLIDVARAGDASNEECSKLAVNYRNWAKDYVRQEIMVDADAREVLYLRDLGVYGRRTGLSYDEVFQKAVADLKIDLDADLEPEEKEAMLDRVYLHIMGKAQETNPGVDAASSGRKKDKKK